MNYMPTMDNSNQSKSCKWKQSEPMIKQNPKNHHPYETIKNGAKKKTKTKKRGEQDGSNLTATSRMNRMAIFLGRVSRTKNRFALQMPNLIPENNLRQKTQSYYSNYTSFLEKLKSIKFILSLPLKIVYEIILRIMKIIPVSIKLLKIII